MCFALRHYQNSDSPSIGYTLYTLELGSGSAIKAVDVVFDHLTDEQRNAHGNPLSHQDARNLFQDKFRELENYNAARLSLLSVVQRSAVKDFLTFMVSEPGDRGLRETAQRALQSGW